jgi:hypothetical protein
VIKAQSLDAPVMVGIVVYHLPVVVLTRRSPVLPGNGVDAESVPVAIVWIETPCIALMPCEENPVMRLPHTEVLNTPAPGSDGSSKPLMITNPDVAPRTNEFITESIALS